jgi:hypothetical protein
MSIMAMLSKTNSKIFLQAQWKKFLLSIAIIDIDLIPPGAGPETLSFALRATRRASGRNGRSSIAEMGCDSRQCH